MASPSLNQYLATANRIIGKRTPVEVAYDNEVLRWLDITKDIRSAISKANEKFPSEALMPEDSQYADLEARYGYIRGHEELLRKLRR